MKRCASPSFPTMSLKAMIATFLMAMLLLGPGMGRVAAQDATAEPSGAFIETVGGKTMRELPAPIHYDANGDGSLDAGELATAVEERYPKIIWPEAYAVPVEDLLAGIEASDVVSWPIGSEFRVLEVPAVCAWFTVYLDAYESGNTLQQPAALDQAMYVLGGARGLTTGESLAAVDGVRYATLGDPARIQAFVEDGPCDDPIGSVPDATPVASPVSRVRGVVR